MAPTTAFDDLAGRYEAWFDRYEPVYRSEVRALARFVDPDAYGLEIGVGSGRFAEPLSIDVGVDPSSEMLRRARARHVEVVRGVAEQLPIGDATFGIALIVTAICFVDDVDRTLAEAARALRPDGRVVLGYIDRESDVGRHYQAIKDENPFYRHATFVSTDELLGTLDGLGYTDVETVQTVFDTPDGIETVEPVEKGYGKGSFVALAARAPVD